MYQYTLSKEETRQSLSTTRVESLQRIVYPIRKRYESATIEECMALER